MQLITDIVINIQQTRTSENGRPQINYTRHSVIKKKQFTFLNILLLQEYCISKVLTVMLRQACLFGVILVKSAFLIMFTVDHTFKSVMGLHVFLCLPLAMLPQLYLLVPRVIFLVSHRYIC